jgi:monoamine oxidase
MRPRSRFLPLLVMAAACHREPATAPAPPAPAVAPRVIVVGGGITGLVSAYELGKRGIATEILEASDTWGGRVATAYYADDAYGEYGMQEMWASSPLLRVARELALPLEDKAEKPYSSVVIDGKLYPYVQSTPDAYFASFLDPGAREALRSWMAAAKALRTRALAAGPTLGPELEHLQRLSFGEWVETFKLPRRASEWIRLTIECELATDWRSFSGLIGLVEMGFFLDPGEPNYHVHGGNARLVSALVAAIPGKKALSATVTAIERWRTADGRTRARVSYLRNQRVETVEADRVILAVPFFRVHQIRIDPPLSDEKWAAIRSLDRGQYVVVHLLLDKGARAIWSPPGGEAPFPVLTDGPLGVVYGVTHPSPPAEPTDVFSLLVHGDAAAAFHMIPRDTKVREILGALDRLWPGLSAHVRGSHVFSYHPAAIPVWPPGRSPLDAGGRSLREPELGLYLAGDYTVSAHANGAAESAEAAAARISEELRPPAATPRSPPGPRQAERQAP